jgi:hypothetical protein
LFHDATRASCLELPVIDLAAVPGTTAPVWPGIKG